MNKQTELAAQQTEWGRKQVALGEKQTELSLKQDAIIEAQLARRIDPKPWVNVRQYDAASKTILFDVGVENRGTKTMSDFYFHWLIDQSVGKVTTNRAPDLSTESGADGKPFLHFRHFITERVFPKRAFVTWTFTIVIAKPGRYEMGWVVSTEDGDFPASGMHPLVLEVQENSADDHWAVVRRRPTRPTHADRPATAYPRGDPRGF